MIFRIIISLFCYSFLGRRIRLITKYPIDPTNEMMSHQITSFPLSTIIRGGSSCGMTIRKITFGFTINKNINVIMLIDTYGKYFIIFDPLPEDEID